MTGPQSKKRDSIVDLAFSVFLCINLLLNIVFVIPNTVCYGADEVTISPLNSLSAGATPFPSSTMPMYPPVSSQTDPGPPRGGYMHDLILCHLDNVRLIIIVCRYSC